MSQRTLQKHISRLMALLLCFMLFLPSVPTAHADGGNCGASLSWSFSDNTLTITGSGAMTDYGPENFAPWYSFRQDIYQLSLPEGLTTVGNLAFYDCVNISAVSLPSTVTDIGELGFCQNRSMRMLTLNNGLRTIGRSAFESCESLQDLRIPNTVTTIGKNAFYSCKSLNYVTVPASVTGMGSGVFSYCDNLVRVDVNASVGTLPTWSFYGCDNLSTVTFNGESLDAGSLKTESTSSGNVSQTTIPTDTGSSAESLDVQQQEDGSVQITGSTTTKTENSTITKTEDYKTDETGDVEKGGTDITASVITPDGWNEVVNQVLPNQEIAKTDQTEDIKTDVTVYLPADGTVPEEILKELAGSNVNLTIDSGSGTKFKIDCSELDAESIGDGLDLSYTILRLDEVPDGINALTAYQLIFNASCDIKVEAMIRLPLENVRHAASLYQLGSKDSYDFLQSVVVDNEGYAHYYLAAIDKDIQYLIAMDVQGEQSAQAIIPDNLYDEYTLIDSSTGKPYVITGRSSSWNMGLGKVMAILAVVMVSAIVVVGAVMFFWNKQRLKAGYVPQWDDEEENT